MSLNTPSRKLVSQASQSMIESPRVPRSRFVTTWNRLTTFNQGDLIPVFVDEVLPGDYLRYNVKPFVRMATNVFPMMSSLKVEVFLFFCAARLLWEDWEKMWGQQLNPSSSVNYSLPTMTFGGGGPAPLTLYDHLGLPCQGQIDPAYSYTVQSLPMRMYNFVWNEFFRDQDLQNSAYFSTASGAEPLVTNYVIRKRNKSHDYFTTCRPWPQKFTAPDVPMAGQAPIYGLGYDGAQSGPGTFNEVNGGVAQTFSVYNTNALRANIDQVYADLGAASAGFTINAFRQAMAIQASLERAARGGTRYVEVMRTVFGVTLPDFRAQRPEYFGGGSEYINITPIAQTVDAADTGGLGSLGGAGTSYGEMSGSYAALEFGYVMCLINVKSELAYQQGIHKLWDRSVKTDFYQPDFAGLGEQAVLRRELFARGNGALDGVVFGYQERHQEYRTKYSDVAGYFRSTTPGTLDAWHTVQEFDPIAPPVLGDTFIRDRAPMDRVLKAGEEALDQEFLADIVITRDATRPLPLYGTPSTLATM